MQLRHLTALALLLLSARAEAENRFDTHVSYFGEPARGQSLHVIHPEIGIEGDATRWLTLRAGYDVDIVTGATPRIYGAAPDAISSATSFSDYRHSVHASADVKIGPATLTAGYTFGNENDYRSHVLDASARVDLWGKNTTLKIGYSHNWDTVCDADNRGAQPLERRALSSSAGCFKMTSGLVTEPLAIDSYYLGWTQVVSPIVLLDLGASFQALDGFQSNPYRLVRLFGGQAQAQEAEPQLRQRLALQGRLKIALKKLHAALGLLGRFYWDTWDIKSGTVEITWEQYLGRRLILRFRGRWYQQGRAIFYRDAGEALSYEAVGPVGQYFVGDRELSPFRNWLTGAKLSWVKSADEKGKVARVLESVELNAKTDLMIYERLTPLPPNSARMSLPINAIIAEVGMTLRW